MLSLTLLVILPGCATTTSSVAPTNTQTVKVACGSFNPIYWQRADTDKTIEQIKGHNASGKVLCGWGKKVSAKPPAREMLKQAFLARHFRELAQ